MRLLIVEDNPVLLQKLAMALEGEPGITVVGAFGSAEEALEALARVEPEAALVDLGLPGMSGIELIRAVRERSPDVDMVAHRVFEDRDKHQDANIPHSRLKINETAPRKHLLSQIAALTSGAFFCYLT